LNVFLDHDDVAMDTKRENLIIIGVFLLCITVLVLISMSPEKKIVEPQVLNPFQLRNISLQTQKDAPADSEREDVRYFEDNEHILEGWGRDPFENIWIGENSVKETAPEVDAGRKKETLVLSLILISETQKTATINHRIVREGDMIQNEKVIKIQKSCVVLEKNGEQRFLSLKRSPLILQIDE